MRTDKKISMLKMTKEIIRELKEHLEKHFPDDAFEIDTCDFQMEVLDEVIEDLKTLKALRGKNRVTDSAQR